MPRKSYFKNTNERVIAWVISCAMFMEALDTTIINTAVPIMAQSFNVDPVNLKVALISYLISLAIFIPISGWVADKFGSKQVFISALVIFSISSIWCGFSQSLVELVCARVLQGFGGSMMLPVGRLIILRTFGHRRLVIAMNKIVTVGILGSMLGPVLGGFIANYFSWHWIFWVNVPFGIIAILMAGYYFESAHPDKVPTLDIFGFILFGSSLAGITFGLSSLSETTVPQLQSMVIILMAILLLIGYFYHSRKIVNPVIDVELFEYRTFKISMLGNLLARLGFGGIPFLLPLMLQISLGYTATTSGMLLAPLALGVVVSKQFTLEVLDYLGYRKLLVVNTIIVGISLWSCMLINQNTPVYVIGILTFVFGILVSLQYSGMNSLAYTQVTPEHLSGAASVMSTMQQLTQSFGVAISALLLRYLAPSGSPNFGLSIGVFHATFLILGLITLLSVFIFLQLKSDDGKQMLG